MLPDLRAWVFAVRTFAGAMLALWCAMALDLDRPYWAMATAYIVAQPLTGSMRSKGLYRLIGTVVGAVVVVGLVPLLVDAPELLTAALASWTGLCLFVALLDRTPRSYVFMLAGYSAAIIGFPATADPSGIFSIALARVEEITLGIVCTIVVGSIVFPRPIGPVVAARIDVWRADAERWALEALRGAVNPDPRRADRRRLAADAIEIGQLSSHLAFDASNYQGTTRWVDALQRRVLTLLPVLSSIEDRIAALRRLGPLSPDREQALAEVAAWVVERPPPDALRARLRALAPAGGGALSWPEALWTTLVLRLVEMIDLLWDTSQLRAAIAAGDHAPPPLVVPEGAIAGRVLHRDPGLAALSGFAAALAVGLVVAFWIGSGWSEGAIAAQMAAVGASFFAVQDDPVPAILRFTGWALVACVVDAAYLFAILPIAHDFEMLVLALAPAFVFYGLLIAMPATTPIGMGLGVNGATLLALQATYAADAASFGGSVIALTVGLGTAALVTALIRSVGAEWSARRLLRASWADLVQAAKGGADRSALASRLLDRMGLLVPRLAAVAPDADRAAADLLAELRVGVNIVELQQGRADLPPAAANAVARALRALSGWFQRRRHRGGPTPPPALLAALDAALRSVWEAGAVQERALLNLVGIRQALFPAAPPPDPA
ncbi:MAG: FUSC family protein [Rhodospirillales bacterium]|nr:FUSC family protein [Rhodospirillales bacterium]